MTARVRPRASKDRPSWTVLFRDDLAFYDATLPPADLEGSLARLPDPQRPDRFGLVSVVDDNVAGISTTAWAPSRNSSNTCAHDGSPRTRLDRGGRSRHSLGDLRLWVRGPLLCRHRVPARELIVQGENPARVAAVFSVAGL